MWKDLFRAMGMAARSGGASGAAQNYVSTLARADQARQVQVVDWRIDALASIGGAPKPAPQPVRRVNSLRDLLRVVAENPRDAVSDGA